MGGMPGRQINELETSQDGDRRCNKRKVGRNKNRHCSKREGRNLKGRTGFRLLLTIEMTRTKRESPDLEDEFYVATAGSKRPKLHRGYFPAQ